MEITDEMVARAARTIDPDLDGKLRYEQKMAEEYRSKPSPTQEDIVTANQFAFNAVHWEKMAHRRARRVLEAALLRDPITA